MLYSGGNDTTAGMARGCALCIGEKAGTRVASWLASYFCLLLCQLSKLLSTSLRQRPRCLRGTLMLVWTRDFASACWGVARRPHALLL
jgi:hypothetical protein